MRGLRIGRHMDATALRKNACRVLGSATRAVALGVLTICVVGCGSPNPQSQVKNLIRRANDTNGKRLGNFYIRHQVEASVSPKDEAAFKNFIAGRPADELAERGVSADSIDKLFVSERDGQPFFIRYGVKRSEGSRAVVFESQGSGGMAAVILIGPGGATEVLVPPGEIEDYKGGKKDMDPAPPPSGPPDAAG